MSTAVQKTEFPCRPTDPDLPYFTKGPDGPQCGTCLMFESDPHPGFFTWVQAMARHFDDAHNVVLVGR